MEIHWPQYHFDLILTADGSPSLQLLNSESSEAMHHSGGAYSETQQIYGDPLRQSLSLGCRSVLSVGLGLGYNEILVASEAILVGISPRDFNLLSFESEEILKEHFLIWLDSKQDGFVYDNIFGFFQNSEKRSQAKTLNKQDLKDWLLEARSCGKWKLAGALLSDFAINEKYEVIFYDAFSAKTTPLLWAEEFLFRFFSQACSEKAQVSSYACTGALNRALKRAGFQLLPREGFCGKRNSTWAQRS